MIPKMPEAMRAAGVRPEEFDRLPDGRLIISTPATIRMTLIAQTSQARALQDWLVLELFPTLSERGAYTMTDRGRAVWGDMFALLCSGAPPAGIDPWRMPFYLPPKAREVK
jgi:hypothetical protein